MYVWGGYAKRKDKGHEMTDMWALHLNPLLEQNGSPTWEKVSQRGTVPSSRSGSSWVLYKNRCVVFGGVHDEEHGRFGIDSVFYDDMYIFDIDKRRWYPLLLRGVKDPPSASGGNKNKKKKVKPSNATKATHETDEGEGSDDNGDENDNMFAFIDENGDIVYMEYDDDGEEAPPGFNTNDTLTMEGGETFDTEEREKMKEAEADAAQKRDEEALAKAKAEKEAAAAAKGPSPCGRMKTNMTVLGNSLVLYGGVTDVGDKQITLDDVWALDLKKLDRWENLVAATSQVWFGDEEDDDEDLDEEQKKQIQKWDERDNNNSGSDYSDDDEEDSDSDDGEEELDDEETLFLSMKKALEDIKVSEKKKEKEKRKKEQRKERAHNAVSDDSDDGSDSSDEEGHPNPYPKTLILTLTLT
jgi:hypothetical protein